MTNPRRSLFVAAIFAGSFLLFLVQPLMARLALPRLGGTPNVWNSAMLVYQALLLGGYAYAHLIGRLTLRRQLGLHIALLIAAALTLPLSLADLSDFGAGMEALWVPALLFASVGPVFFLISAQAPLIQRCSRPIRARATPMAFMQLRTLAALPDCSAIPCLSSRCLALATKA